MAAKAVIGMGSNDEGRNEAMLPGFAVDVGDFFPNRRKRVRYGIAG